MSVPSNLPGIPADEYPSPAQFTTPVDDGYAALIGQATYAWTYLEWQVVCIGEKISPGFVHVATALTAGNMGKELANELKAFVGDPTLATKLTTLASDFDVLVKRRNSITGRRKKLSRPESFPLKFSTGNRTNSSRSATTSRPWPEWQPAVLRPRMPGQIVP